MSLQINELGPRDVEQVVALLEGTAIPADGSSKPHSAAADVVMRYRRLGLVAREGDRVVGAVLCMHDPVNGYLNHILMAEGFEGSAVLNELVNKMLAKLRGLGIRKWRISLPDAKLAAAFWEAAKFPALQLRRA